MFSELVDQAVRSSGRPDALADLAFHMNGAMRAIHMHSDWDDDTFEEQAVVNGSTNSVIWTPSFGRRLMRRIEFVVDATNYMPRMTRPSTRLMDNPDLPFYYASGDGYVFANVVGFVKIYGWRYSRPLQYYPVNQRPATFNFDTLAWSTVDPVVLERVTNWLLERHSEVVLEGTLAAFYRSKQDPRNQLHYAAFREGLVRMVSAESSRELIARR